MATAFSKRAVFFIDGEALRNIVECAFRRLDLNWDKNSEYLPKVKWLDLFKGVCHQYNIEYLRTYIYVQKKPKAMARKAANS